MKVLPGLLIMLFILHSLSDLAVKKRVLNKKLRTAKKVN